MIILFVGYYHHDSGSQTIRLSITVIQMTKVNLPKCLIDNSPSIGTKRNIQTKNV